jgi:adenosylhomocysteine nucleosidase
MGRDRRLFVLSLVCKEQGLVMTTCVVCGMASEAAIIGRPPGAIVIVGAGDAAALSAKLEAAIAAGADRVISLGLAGAINIAMEVGDVVVGVSAVYPGTGDTVAVCDPAWRDRLFEALTEPSVESSIGSRPFALSPPFRVDYGRFAWSPTAVGRFADKASLRKTTGADVVDEESFISGLVAKAHGLPWAALRVVLDLASFELPPAALVRLTAAGADDMGAILVSILRDPWEIPELVELAVMSATALSNLRAALARVGPDFAAT